MPEVPQIVNDTDSEEEEEYEYGLYGVEYDYDEDTNKCKVIINVAGGGMMNGNAYATVEAHFEGEQEDVILTDDTIDGWEYCEYGIAPIKNKIGNYMEIDDEGYNFRIV